MTAHTVHGPCLGIGRGVTVESASPTDVVAEEGVEVVGCDCLGGSKGSAAGGNCGRGVGTGAEERMGLEA